MTLFETVFRGNDTVYELTEQLITEAMEKYGAEQSVGFPNTAYCLPCYYAVTGVKIKTLSEDVYKRQAPGSDNYDDTACRNITVSNCKFKNVSRGVGSHSAVDGVFVSNVVVTNNTFENVYNEPIKIINYKDTVISNNQINNCKHGILVHTRLNESSYYDPLPGTVTEKVPSAEDQYNYNVAVPVSYTHLDVYKRQGIQGQDQ